MTLRQLARAYLAHRYAVLFYSLLVTFGVGPLLAALDVNRNVLRVFLELNVFAAVFGVSGLPRRRPLQIILVALVAVRLVAYVAGAHALLAATTPMVALIAFGVVLLVLAAGLGLPYPQTWHGRWGNDG